MWPFSPRLLQVAVALSKVTDLAMAPSLASVPSVVDGCGGLGSCCSLVGASDTFAGGASLPLLSRVLPFLELSFFFLSFLASVVGPGLELAELELRFGPGLESAAFPLIAGDPFSLGREPPRSSCCLSMLASNSSHSWFSFWPRWRIWSSLRLCSSLAVL